MERKTNYASDLTNRQWQIIRQLLPKPRRRGRKPICRRRVINAILYVVRSGCQWRMLPADFPNWNTVYGIFWKWRNEGVWRKIHDALRQKSCGEPLARSRSPQSAVLYTILAGAKRHRIEPWAYVRELLLRLHADDPGLEEMLPDRWAASHPDAVLTHRLEESRKKAAAKKNRRRRRRARARLRRR